jgi:phosphoribosyl 1,2-cyclic phosphate phosphodiesterase
MSADVELLFLGTGTSAGVPMIACDCAVCLSDDPKDKRTRCSAVVSYGGTRVLIDTTPELRLQAVAQRVKRIDAVVYTHAHADHLMGMDDLRRFNAVKGGPLDVWADEATFGQIDSTFGYAFRVPDPAARVFRPHLVRRRIEGEFEIAGVGWRPIPMLHGGMPVLGFRIGRLAYCTDVSFMPEASFEMLEGLDVLVIDALEYREHPTHFSIPQALEVIARVKPRRALLTHIAHSVSHRLVNGQLPAGVELAYDGMVVTAGGR